jgi:tetratricopeptide (TPR) repeat protein
MAEIQLDQVSRQIKEMYQKGIAAMERGNLDYAVDMLSAAVDAEPRFLLARTKLREVQIRRAQEKKAGLGSQFKAMGPLGKIKGLMKKDAGKALQEGEKLMAIDPLNKQYLLLYADAAEAAKMPEAGVMTLQAVKSHFNKDAEFLDRLAGILITAGLKNQGRDVYEQVHHLNPNDQVALKKFKDAAANASMETGGWTTAEDYRDVIKNKDEAIKLEQESKAKKSDSDLDAMIADLQVKIQRDPKNINHYRHLARMYNEAGMLGEAVDALTQANEVAGGADPTIERALEDAILKVYDYNISVLSESDEKEELAATQQERAAYLLQIVSQRVEKHPNDLQAKFEYGQLLLDTGDINQAIQQFQQSQRHPQRRLESLYYLGRCFKQKQQYDIAVEQLKLAASEMQVMDEAKMDVVYELGLLYEAMGRMDEAMAHFKDIYSRDIGYRDVASKIDRFYQSGKNG